MIPLRKLEEPEMLRRNRARWTAELLAAIETGDKKLIQNRKKKYNQKEVKDQLKRETREKCAYCESRVTVVAHGDIEHVTPKSIEPERTFDWSNLTFACQICNQNKTDKEDIFDPYVDPIEEVAYLAPPYLVGRTVKTKSTIIQLDLNRVELIEDRTAHIRDFSRALEAIENEANEDLRTLLITQLERELDIGDAEYILMKRFLLEAYKQSYL
jgi:hypothetical protein